jgi:opacity protein-like surface antigen
LVSIFSWLNMIKSMRLLIALCVLLALATPLAAQTPDTGMLAAGADVGVLFPDERFEQTLTLDAVGEYYLTPRISVRGLLGWASPGFQGRTEDHFRQVKLLFNGVYNWEYGTWHPYVTGGAGAYFVRQLFDGRDDPERETRGGINLGGGVEYFATEVFSVKGEARWDIVSDPPGLPDATGFNLTIGFKRYF